MNRVRGFLGRVARVGQHSVQTNPGGGVFTEFSNDAKERALGPTEAVCE